MDFIDDNHEDFYEEKLRILKQQGKEDVYYKSVIYTLGICEDTRKNFNKIFNIDKGEINVDSLQEAWQTGISMKVTRLAFNLWNDCKYDSRDDFKNRKTSSLYNVSEIFCCGYANYFITALQIRYPEYFARYKERNMLDKNKDSKKKDRRLER